MYTTNNIEYHHFTKRVSQVTRKGKHTKRFIQLKASSSTTSYISYKLSHRTRFFGNRMVLNRTVDREILSGVHSEVTNKLFLVYFSKHLS